MNKIIYYLSRAISILLVAFFAVFILEGFGPGSKWQNALSHVVMTLIVLAITIVAWKWPKIGGFIFIALGIFFCIFFHASWWSGLIMSAAPLLLGVLFLVEGFSLKSTNSKS
ncbi:MAG: hypothetical protein WC523_06945 [Patescibacteria group bacterium]